MAAVAGAAVETEIFRPVADDAADNAADGAADDAAVGGDPHEPVVWFYFGGDAKDDSTPPFLQTVFRRGVTVAYNSSIVPHHQVTERGCNWTNAAFYNSMRTASFVGKSVRRAMEKAAMAARDQEGGRAVT